MKIRIINLFVADADNAPLVVSIKRGQGGKHLGIIPINGQQDFEVKAGDVIKCEPELEHGMISEGGAVIAGSKVVGYRG